MIEPVIIKRRVAPQSTTDSDADVEKLHEQHWISQLLYSRGVSKANELEFSLANLPPPDHLHDIEPAAKRLAEAINLQQRIVVIGDYDCDGATSTALAVLALRAMGAEFVNYCLPNRFVHGYGLSPAVVDEALQFSPDLIITVDNGTTSLEGVASATDRGIDVVITDHHLPATDLPQAVALVNPRLGTDAISESDSSTRSAVLPGVNLAGVGVIFFVMAALRRHLERDGWFESRQLPVPNMANYLDLVAVGTVADVVPLDAVNRILVMQGVRRIRAGRCRPGLSALLELAGTSVESVLTDTIGFRIAPRLNAAGRLDDMRHGVECLLADDQRQARKLAEVLDNHNRQRRNISEDMQRQADAVLSEHNSGVSPSSKPQLSICLYDPSWHEGTIGILAGRLKEQYGSPAIVFTREQSDELPTRIKGSARSIDGYHIVDAFKRIRLQQPALLERFGGHAKAAGLTLDEPDFGRFCELFEADLQAYFDGRLPGHEIITDGPLPIEALSVETAQLLEYLAPWGQEFPVPVFDNRFQVADARLMQGKHLKLVLHPQTEAGTDARAGTVEAVCFNFAGNARVGDTRTPAGQGAPGSADVDEPDASDMPFVAGDQLRILFELKTNTFRNRTSLQLNCRYLQKV